MINYLVRLDLETMYVSADWLPVLSSRLSHLPTYMQDYINHSGPEEHVMIVPAYARITQVNQISPGHKSTNWWC